MRALPAGIRVRDVRSSLTEFHARFADLFARSEPRERSRAYLYGLLGGVERRNGWQLAEHLGESTPDGAQRLLNGTHWSASDARDRLVTFCAETFGDPEGILVFDETGFLKKGDKSAGVQRQYSGTAGKVENCQIGVFAAYVTDRAHVLVDRALYLPEAWTSDRERCREAGIPEHVAFRTKPRAALRIHHRLRRLGLSIGWVTGDEVYGDNPELRAGLERRGVRYVLAVSASSEVWPEAPVVRAPVAVANAQGRPRTRPTVSTPSVPVADLAASWDPEDWQRLAVHQGEKGPIVYEWVARRVIHKRAGLPLAEGWLLVRRSISNPTEVAYYLSNASADTSLEQLAHVASSRYRVEQCFEEAKDDFGLDQYEVRSWTAWHRFMTLCMMAMAWVASVRQEVASSPPPSREARSPGTAAAGRAGKRGASES
jgi:SRSO17 transposase